MLALPAVRCLHRSFPDATITWITSPLAFAMLQGLEGVNFAVYDKPRSLKDYRAFYHSFSQRRFDVVLEMQANLRINLLYPALKSPVKIGFDRIRAREGQWLFSNRKIPFANEHLADSFLAFAAALGADISTPDLSIPIPEPDTRWAQQQLASLPRPLIAIHPFASKQERNWLFERHAEVIRETIRKWNAGFVLTGGNAAAELDCCQRLAAIAPEHILNLCGKTTPKQLAAILGEADALIAPDTAAVHIARAMNTKVIGLYAIAPPELSGPYRAQEHVVNRYPEAVSKYLQQDSMQVPWNTRVHHPDAMSLIQVDDVILKLQTILS